uniref:Uncharacterized protein n=1 Tax=Anguilla anguilla TaxID=7936 RepID=A0A0E9W0L4_ANGAN
MGYSRRILCRVTLLSAENRKIRLQRACDYQTGRMKIENTSPDLTKFDFCFDTQIVGSEFGVNSVNPCQRCRLEMAV